MVARAFLVNRFTASLLAGVALVMAADARSSAQRALQPNQLQLFVSAVDAAGAPVTDLKPEDIVMTENGAPGRVVSVERFSLPIKLTLAVDNGRESATALAVFRAGLTGLVEALPPDVEVALITTAPQPSFAVRPTTDRALITRGIQRFGIEADESARFTDALVEYAERLEKDFKDKKLTYAPVLVMVSTSAPDVSDIQRDTIERGLKTLQARGARVSLAMTTTKPTDAESVSNLKEGRQALIAGPIVNASRGKFEVLNAFRDMAALLPAWGKDVARSHAKQLNQFRVVIERPGGATGQLNKPGFRLARQGLNGSVSMDGRFLD